MIFFKKNILLILAAVIPGILSLIIVYFDKSFQYQQISLILYSSSIFLTILISSYYLINFKHLFNFDSKFKTLFLIIFLGAIFTRLIFLKSYPFVALGDEVRDGGLNAVQIYKHQISNVFAYGRYDAHGLIIPNIISPFYSVFSDSVMTYRFPTALVGIFDILLIYIFISLIISPEAGFWAALVLITLPLHLFYSRTQAVVIFSSFLTTCLLISVYFYFSKINYWRLSLLGLLIGLSFNFHASIKTVAIVIFIFILFNEVRHLFKNYKKIFLFILFTIIGFGPRIWFSPLSIFFHTSRISIFDPFSTESIFQQFLNLSNKYLQSLLVWFIEPTRSFFNNQIPLLNPLFFFILLTGIIYLFKTKTKNSWLKFLVFLSLAIPFTNSAITDGVNFDHRLAPLFPIAAILVGFGVYIIKQKIKYPLLKYIFCFFIFTSLIYQTCIFFIKRQADVNWNNFFTEKDYLSIHLINLVKSHPQSFSSNLCVRVSDQNYPYFQLVHIKEQYQYLLPKYFINFIPDEKVPLNMAYLNQDCSDQNSWNSYYYFCSRRIDYSCPKNYSGNFLIYY